MSNLTLSKYALTRIGVPGQFAVGVRLSAYQTNGSVLHFGGAYFVGLKDGAAKITTAQLREE